MAQRYGVLLAFRIENCVKDVLCGRRRRIQAAVPPDVAPMSVVAFPLMGVGDFTLPSAAPGSCY